MAPPSTARPEFIVGTSGYSFPDWVGTYYPAGTRPAQMLDFYARRFRALEPNFTFSGVPSAATLDRMVRRTPPGFLFWVKANQELTHKQNLSATEEFTESLAPLASAGKLAGVLLQFPQSFHRTILSRRYLQEALSGVGRALADLAEQAPAAAPAPAGLLLPLLPLPAPAPATPPPATELAVEFRHESWNQPSVVQALRERQVTLVVPDVPDLPGLYRPPPTATTSTGYLRLHSRNPAKWYRAADELSQPRRYDYDYSQPELKELAQAWSRLDTPAERVYTFFNNCYGGQAGKNAEAFEKIVRELGA